MGFLLPSSSQPVFWQVCCSMPRSTLLRSACYCRGRGAYRKIVWNQWPRCSNSDRYLNIVDTTVRKQSWTFKARLSMTTWIFRSCWWCAQGLCSLWADVTSFTSDTSLYEWSFSAKASYLCFYLYLRGMYCRDLTHDHDCQEEAGSWRYRIWGGAC